jgi:FHA domain
MPTCRFCGESMPAELRTCSVCGSALPELVPIARVVAPAATQRFSPVTVPATLPPGGRFCPGCGTVYGTDYADSFCRCGTELVGDLPAAAVVEPDRTIPVAVDLPPPATTCLVLYGPDRAPVRYFPLTKDATLIGRLDAAGGNFPDIDVDEWLDAATARRISRQHALVLRARASGSFSLRPLPGNTGTQLEAEMVLPMHDYPLVPGRRFILGGVARFKFEIT